MGGDSSSRRKMETYGRGLRTERRRPVTKQLKEKENPMDNPALDGSKKPHIEIAAYEPPRLLELGDLAMLTNYAVSVRVP
jgi:hypothetical protein